MQQLQQKIEYLQSEFLRERDQEMGRQVAEQINRLEERNVQEHAEMTKTLYEEISSTLRQKQKDEEKSKLIRQKERLEAEFRKQMHVKESEFAQILASERKEASKVNLKNVALEEEVRRLSKETNELEQTKENLMRQQAEYDLQPVKGADG